MELAGRGTTAYVLCSEELAMRQVMYSLTGDKQVGREFADTGINMAQITVGGYEFTLSLGRPMDDPSLQAHARGSSLPKGAVPLITGHAGVVAILPPQGADPVDVQGPLTELTSQVAYFIRSAGLVWLPHQGCVLTDAAYAEQADERLARLWFHVRSSTDRRGEAVARTRGLRALGGHEVRLPILGGQSSVARENLRLAVCEVLEDGRMPKAGDILTIGGVEHELVCDSAPDAADDPLVDDDTMLTAQPVAGQKAGDVTDAAPEPAQPQAKWWSVKRWVRR